MHECAAPGCRRRIMATMLMCGRHWHAVPKALRGAVWAAWERRQGVPAEGGGPSAVYREAVEAHEAAKRAAVESLGVGTVAVP